MSKYTFIKDRNVDRIIDDDLSIIVNTLVEKCGNFIRSIYLTGGFGRGEGVIKKENKRYIPLNDYDILIIHKFFYKKKIIKCKEQISQQLNKKVKVKQVDLAVISPIKLFIPFNSVARYEIKHGKILIFGKKTIINSFSSKMIPLIEGSTYYTTRMGGLLIAYLLLIDASGYEESKRNELAYLEIQKAKLVLGDTFLIKNKAYHYSYLVRQKRIVELAKRNKIDQNILKIYIKALMDRNKIVEGFPTIDELKEEWTWLTKLILENFLKYESYLFNVNIKSMEDYTKVLQKRSLIFKFKNYFNARYSYKSYELTVKFYLILNNLVNGKFPIHEIFNENCSEKFVDEIINVLSIWHPDGIIKEIISNRN